MVLMILDASFDVLIIRYGVVKRVYVNVSVDLQIPFGIAYFEVSVLLVL